MATWIIAAVGVVILISIVVYRFLRPLKQRKEETYPRQLSLIWQSLTGIEAVVASGLYLLLPLLPSFYIALLFRSRYLGIDTYVVLSVVLTIGIWSATPTELGALVCSYISASTVVALLQVVFLSKLLGPILSAERSLILFVLNVVQIVFTFSIWYQLEAGLSRENALFNALLVLGTVGYYDRANVLVGLQIATDLLLFAIFLASLIGRVGTQPDKD